MLTLALHSGPKTVKMNEMISSNGALVRTNELTRIYHVGSREVPALQGVNLTLGVGTLVALRGRSGSGKTTLLNCIGGLDRPTSGQVWFQERNISQLSELERVRLRRHKIGFVFQSHALLMTYSAQENVDLMLRLKGLGRRERQQRVLEVLTLVGFDNTLSGETEGYKSIFREVNFNYPDHQWDVEYTMVPLITEYYGCKLAVLQ